MAVETNIAILGAGAWGTALAQALACDGQKVVVWSPEKEVVRSINKTRENAKYLPGIALGEHIEAHHNLEKVAKGANVMFITCPASANTEVASRVRPHLGAEDVVVVCSKGFRETDGALLSDVWREVAPEFENICVLSGPSFALEVAQKKLSAVVLAANSEAVVQRVDELFTAPWFRIYFSTDMVGLQVAAAIKSVVAIAAGVSDGMELGDNARAAIVCRGLAEIARYGTALGAKTSTFMGLGGLGDIMLSVNSRLSRNYRLGYYLGQGLPAEEALARVGGHTEAVHTARIVTEQAVSSGIDLGVIMMIDGILQGDLDARKAFDLVIRRPRIAEFEE